MCRERIIRGRTAMAGLDIPRVAKRAGIPKSTLYNRLKLPGRLTLDEIRSLDRVVKFTPEELVSLIRDP